MAILIAIRCMTCAIAAPADPPSEAAPTAVFATDANAGANVGEIVPGAAAMVDDHIIPMEDVVLTCLRKDRSYVVDQMIQSYVLDRECEKRGITVSEAEIDNRIAELRTNLAPATLEETLKLHHMTPAELRHTFRQSLARPLLVADQVKPARMIRCREILVKCSLEEASVSGTTRTEAAALAIVKEIQNQLKQGKHFEDLAAQYSESVPADKQGDLGVLYGNMLGMEASILTAAMALDKGKISQPVQTTEGYRLIQGISTDSDHPQTEDSLYEDAGKACRDLQVMFLSPKIITDLIDRSKITFVTDEEIAPGKPLPAAAAVVDGHPIAMKDVIAKCLAESGPKTVDILVQNYVVDRECRRRGITVSEAEIDQRVSKLRDQIAPHTIEEGLASHHTTMAGLRRDFQQEIERTKLVVDQVKPTKMMHARAIFVEAKPSGMFKPVSATMGADVEAKKLIADIQDQLKTGKSFGELTRQYSKTGDKSKGGDLGVLYEGMHDMDTAVLNAALAMKEGDISPAPIKAYGGYVLLQAISTSDSHASGEDAAYAEALAVCQNQKAQPLIPQAIVNLIKKSKVVYYVHS
ncbi:MAG: Foldase protein PrsA precursor [Pedosphaera sp.]|nr:Foldase protein PrsA precursor [Pedosphaera sp.]